MVLHEKIIMLAGSIYSVALALTRSQGVLTESDIKLVLERDIKELTVLLSQIKEGE